MMLVSYEIRTNVIIYMYIPGLSIALTSSTCLSLVSRSSSVLTSTIPVAELIRKYGVSVTNEYSICREKMKGDSEAIIT